MYRELFYLGSGCLVTPTCEDNEWELLCLAISCITIKLDRIKISGYILSTELQ